jgi:hypothetical protein
MKDEFSTFDIVKILGIPRMRLKDWMDQGYAVPSKLAEGKGTRAKFKLLDVYALSLFCHLVQDMHFSRQEAAWFSRAWRLYILFSIEGLKDQGNDPQRIMTQLIDDNPLFVVYTNENNEKDLELIAPSVRALEIFDITQVTATEAL